MPRETTPTPSYKDVNTLSTELVKPPAPLGQSTDVWRVMDYLARQGAWQCDSCSRIFPKDTPAFFAVCESCWEVPQGDLKDRLISLPSVAIFSLYRRLLWDSNIGLHMGPYGNPGRLGEAPTAFKHLRILQHRINNLILQRVIKEQAPAHGYQPLWFAANELQWDSDRGLVPVGFLEEDYPPRTDRKAWNELNENYHYVME